MKINKNQGVEAVNFIPSSLQGISTEHRPVCVHMPAI